MLFNSIDFAVFLPIVFLLYWFVANKHLHLRNAFLLVVSYIFYGWWDWRFLSLIFFSSFVDFFVGLGLAKIENQARRRLLLIVTLCTNFGLLGFFKYYNFFAESFVEAFSLMGQSFNPHTLNIILPVGISFYTFQTMSYTLDIYKREFQPTRDPIAFFAFVSFFPQLVAGPIERAANLLPQFYEKKEFQYALASQGLKKMLWGLFMKVAVADRLSLYVEAIYNHAELHTGLSFMVATAFFAIQIYCDFAGYSLMAIGCAEMFGFKLMENFRRPYFATSFKEFWSRWHISLSTWFRDYVYIPLGGNRGSKFRTNANLFTTFVVSGLWHGANWTFVVWGGIHGLLQIGEKSLSKMVRFTLPRVAKIALVFIITCFTWVFFRAATVSDAWHIVVTMVTAPGSEIHIGDKGIFAFSIMSILILFTIDFINEYWPQVDFMNHPAAYVRVGTVTLLIIYIVSLGVFDGSQFIYFQF